MRAKWFEQAGCGRRGNSVCCSCSVVWLFAAADGSAFWAGAVFFVGGETWVLAGCQGVALQGLTINNSCFNLNDSCEHSAADWHVRFGATATLQLLSLLTLCLPQWSRVTHVMFLQ